MRLGELDETVGSRLTAYETRKTELDRDKGRVAVAKEGLAASAQAVALLQAELDARKEVIATHESELASEERSLQSELSHIGQELRELREQLALDRKSEDEVLDGFQEELDRLRGYPEEGAQQSGEADDSSDEERQGSDNG